MIDPMAQIRSLAPWQIMLVAVVALVIFVAGAYYAVAGLTTPNTSQKVQSTIPGDLGGEANQKAVERLEGFEAPRNLPIQTRPLRTPDPDQPSTVNPFSG